jgi:NRAMP (natural resistance-associated macrophage protein)-like metal ion transporter
VTDLRAIDAPPETSPVKQPEHPKLMQIMGPGLITGASDDDPSGIATYSQAGAQFGYAMGWTLLFSYPLMVAIQQISAEIGRVTGKGIAGNLRGSVPRSLLYGLVGLLLVANTINLGADLGAMGAALKLLIGGPMLIYIVLFGIVSVLLEVFARYSRYVSILKWLSLSLFAYVATVLVVQVSWRDVLFGLVPHITLDGKYITMVVAILGTTISPYLFFWQANVEVEDEQENPVSHPLKDAPEQAPMEMERIRLDTYIGMGISNLVALFIIVATAATLHAHGMTDIQTSSQAAEALRPIAGKFAFAVFALGIIGTGMLALPVLAGSAAYAVGEVFEWPVGLARQPLLAKAFYGTIAGATFVGGLLNFTPLDPIKALFWSAVVNGVVAVPVMIAIMLMAAKPAVMGQFVLPIRLKVMGWLATIVMAAATVGMFATWGD